MIKLPAQLTRFGSRADGGAGLGFVTNELSPEQFSDLQRHLHGFGWLVFKGNATGELEELVQGDIPADNAPDDTISPSERIRRAQWVYHKQKQLTEEFEAWRRREAERIAQAYLEKLD